MERTFHNSWRPQVESGFHSTAGVLMDAALHRRLCVVQHFDGRVRIVEPYRVYQARSGRRLLNCYQVAGHTRGTGDVGWKNLYLDDIYATRVLPILYTDRVTLKRLAQAAERYEREGATPARRVLLPAA